MSVPLIVYAFRRDEILVRLPEICHHFLYFLILKGSPQFAAGCRVAIAWHEIDIFFAIAINSNPHPADFFFELIYVCISSISTTSSTESERIYLTSSPKALIQL